MSRRFLASKNTRSRFSCEWGGLNPLGFPLRSAPKRFARAKIKAYAQDPAWLDYFNELIYTYDRIVKGRIQISI